MAIIVEPNATGWQRFTGRPNLSAAKVARLVDAGIWGMVDLAGHGLIEAVAFTVPEGMIRVGPERFEAEAGHVVQVFDTEPAPDPLMIEREAASLSRADFFDALRRANILTPKDRIAAAAGQMPDSIAPIFDGLPEAIQEEAIVRFGAAGQFDRLDPLLAPFAAALGLTDADVDALFGIGGQP